MQWHSLCALCHGQLLRQTESLPGVIVDAGGLFYNPLYHLWYAVAEWYGAGLAIARLRVRIPPLAAVYQRQLIVPSPRGQLMSTSES